MILRLADTGKATIAAMLSRTGPLVVSLLPLCPYQTTHLGIQRLAEMSTRKPCLQATQNHAFVSWTQISSPEFLGGRSKRKLDLPPGRVATFQSRGIQDAQGTDEGNPIFPVHLGVIV